MKDNSEPSNEELPEQVISLLIDGKKIGAIKLVRKQYGSGLKEAKDLVESYMLKHPEKFLNARTSSFGSNTLIYGLIILAVLLTYQFVSEIR